MNLFISSAEPSGDLIGAEVLRNLKKLMPDSLDIRGVGGVFCESEGLRSLFPLSDITVHGFGEVLPKALTLLKRIRQTAYEILANPPDIVLTIDAFDFHYRVARILRKNGFKGRLVHLVAPAVWAWGQSRAQKLMDLYESVLCLFPFEPSYFNRAGVQALYVGNPIFHRFSPEKGKGYFYQKYNVCEGAFILTLLPGSRLSEIKRLLPDFLNTARLIHDHVPSLHIMVPTFEEFFPVIKEQMQDSPFPLSLVTQDDKGTCLTHTHFSIAASGTVALELSLFDFPFIVAYKTSPLTAFIGRRIAKVRFICLINILMDKSIVPELIQEECDPQRLLAASLPLIQNQKKIKIFKQEKEKALSLLRTQEPMAIHVAKFLLNTSKTPSF